MDGNLTTCADDWFDEVLENVPETYDDEMVLTIFIADATTDEADPVKVLEAFPGERQDDGER
jgi:hypothetical protein